MNPDLDIFPYALEQALDWENDMEREEESEEDAAYERNFDCEDLLVELENKNGGPLD